MSTIKASDYTYSISNMNIELHDSLSDVKADIERKVDIEDRNLKKYVRKQIAISRWKSRRK